MPTRPRPEDILPEPTEAPREAPELLSTTIAGGGGGDPDQQLLQDDWDGRSPGCRIGVESLVSDVGRILGLRFRRQSETGVCETGSSPEGAGAWSGTVRSVAPPVWYATRTFDLRVEPAKVNLDD